MRIKSEPEKIDACGADLLDLSRLMRRCREEVESVRCRVQQCAGMDACRAALMKQEETLSDEAVKLVGLSSSLREIAGLYAAAEARNLEALEERPRSSLAADEVLVFKTDSTIHSRIQNILYHQ